MCRGSKCDVSATGDGCDKNRCYVKLRSNLLRRRSPSRFPEFHEQNGYSCARKAAGSPCGRYRERDPFAQNMYRKACVVVKNEAGVIYAAKNIRRAGRCTTSSTVGESEWRIRTSCIPENCSVDCHPVAIWRGDDPVNHAERHTRRIRSCCSRWRGPRDYRPVPCA